MNEERESPPSAYSPWQRGLTQLTALLATGGNAAALADVHQRRLAVEDLQRALRPYLLDALRRAAETMALAIGAAAAAALQFADPSSPIPELHGTRAVLRRLDRIWSGPPLLTLDAIEDLLLPWVGGTNTPLLVLRGSAQCGPRELISHQSLELAIGAVIEVRAHSLLALPRGPAHELLEAAATAGFQLSPLVHDCFAPYTGPSCQLRAGDFTLDEIRCIAHLNQRTIPLNHTEMRALATLAATPGVVISRDLLQSTLGLANPRRLDPVIVNLRNKLGDGVIRTIYGSGYALDAK